MAGPRSIRRASGSIRTFDAFQNPEFRLFWPSNFFNNMSRWTQMTLLPWMVLLLTDSPFLVALIGFFALTPMLLLGVFGGVIADRVDRKVLLLSTQSANLVGAVAMTALLYTGKVEYWHGYVAITVMGLGWALDQPSRRALLHDLVGRRGVTNALALDQMGNYASRAAGPALAGLVISVAGLAGGYVAITIFSCASLLLLGNVRLPASAARSLGARNVLGNLSEGFRYVRGNDVIIAVVAISAVMNMFMFQSLQMVPVLAREVMGVGPGLMGTLMAAEGLGALAGSALIASAAGLRHHGRVYLGGSLLASGALLILGLSQAYWLSMPTLLILGLGTGAFGTMQAAIVILVAREEMRGRALGVVAVSIGLSPFGSLLVGAVASAVSVSFAVGLNGGLAVGLLALVGLLMPSVLRRIDVERPRDERGERD